MLGSWGSVLPSLALAIGVLVIPGLVLGLALRLSPLDALGVSPALSVGALAVADELAFRGHLRWGMVPIGLATVALTLVFLVLSVVLRLRRRADADADARPTAASASGWVRGRAGVSLALVVGAAALGAVAVARGIGWPDRVNQTYDAAFHVNAIQLVVTTGSASPSTVGSLGDFVGTPGFYPPLFHAVAALPVMAFGISPIAAANIMAVAMAAAWPLSVSFLVRRLLGPGVLELGVAMVGSVTVALFPAMLLIFGVLWPNTLSLLVLPAAVALVARLFGLISAPGRLTWGAALASLLVVLPGLYLAHPGAAFALVLLTAPMLVEVEAATVIRAWRAGADARRSRLAAVALVVGTLVVLAVTWQALREIPSLNAVRSFNWKPRESYAQGVGEALLLASPVTPANAAFGILTVVGAVDCLRRGRHLWLVMSHVAVAGLAIIAASEDSALSHLFTGFWYNDAYRIYAVLPITALPLAALGARWALTWSVPRLRRFSGSVPALLRGHAAIAMLAAVAVLVPVGSGVRAVGRAVSRFYNLAELPAADILLTSSEQAMYRRLAREVPPGGVIAGSPWTGETYAQIFSGHAVLWPTMSPKNDADRALLVERFRDFATDPAVCAAVKRQHVAVVVTDSQLFWADIGAVDYPGFDDLSGVPGLTKIDQAGTATAYVVGECSG